MQFDLVLRRQSLELTRHFVLYPGSSIIREWSGFRNAGTALLEISDPRFLRHVFRVARTRPITFHWMRGGENRPGSWTLQTETLRPGRVCRFDSYDPFGSTAEGNFWGDGVQAQVLHNGKVVWPPAGRQRREWDCVLNAASPTRIDFALHLGPAIRSPPS